MSEQSLVFKCASVFGFSYIFPWPFGSRGHNIRLKWPSFGRFGAFSCFGQFLLGSLDQKQGGQHFSKRMLEVASQTPCFVEFGSFFKVWRVKRESNFTKHPTMSFTQGLPSDLFSAQRGLSAVSFCNHLKLVCSEDLYKLRRKARFRKL